MEKLRNDKTLIVISHRLANVKNADKIYLLDKGNLVEEGNHEELMNKKINTLILYQCKKN